MGATRSIGGQQQFIAYFKHIISKITLILNARNHNIKDLFNTLDLTTINESINSCFMLYTYVQEFYYRLKPVSPRKHMKTGSISISEN